MAAFTLEAWKSLTTPKEDLRQPSKPDTAEKMLQRASKEVADAMFKMTGTEPSPEKIGSATVFIEGLVKHAVAAAKIYVDNPPQITDGAQEPIYGVHPVAFTLDRMYKPEVDNHEHYREYGPANLASMYADAPPTKEVTERKQFVESLRDAIAAQRTIESEA